MTFDDCWTRQQLARRGRRENLLELVMSLFHGWLCGAHFFAAMFFRFVRRVPVWFWFHLVAGTISLVCFFVHARDARKERSD